MFNRAFLLFIGIFVYGLSAQSPVYTQTNNSNSAISPNLYVGDAFTKSLAAGTAMANQSTFVVDNIFGTFPAGTTDANGNITATGHGANIGTYTETWYVGGQPGAGGVPSNSVTFTVLSLACSGFASSSANLGTVSQGIGTFFPVTFNGVASSATAVDLIVWNDAQSMSNANVISMTSVGNGTWRATVNTSSYSALGSYAIQGRVHGNNGATALCSNPAFYEQVNSTFQEIRQQHISCDSIAGTWNGSQLDKWTLSQSGSSVSGSLAGTNPCGDSTSYQVSGSVNRGGGFNLTATNPNPPSPSPPDSCSAFPSPVTLSVGAPSNASCDSASGTIESSTLGPVNDTLTMSPSIPTGETSQGRNLTNSSDIWETSSGNGTQAHFEGILTSPSNGTVFGGRMVQETVAGTLTDGCANASNGMVEPVSSTIVNGNWNVQGDNSYGDDIMGYNPVAVRIFQAYVTVGGVSSCSLTFTQQMQINGDNSSWINYKQNQFAASMSPTQISVTRDPNSSNGSVSKSYPVQ